MIGELEAVVLDCPLPASGLARFYRGLLGGDVDRPDPRWSLDEAWSTLHLATGQVLAFQGVVDHRPPVWGDPTRPQQAHLDVAVPDLAVGRAAVLALGATVLDDPDHGRFAVFADPAGHPFCLVSA